jgi:hypothetical protein
MASIANLVHQTATTTGTGDFTLASVNGKQTFATAFSTGSTQNVFYYFISNQSAAEWEVGTGHMSDATTLVRDTVLKSSNSNSAVSFSAGTKDVANDIPASYQVFTIGSAGLLRQTTTFTSSGTYTKPSWLKFAIVEVQGGGGGGGGIKKTTSAGAAGGGGGGSGEYARKKIDAASIGATETVTIGAAGAAGTTTPTDGGSGGTTSFGSLLGAVGGAGGGQQTEISNIDTSGSRGAGGSGGTGTADLRINGQTGTQGLSNGTSAFVIGTSGGNSRFGFGGASIAGTGSATGLSATGYGAGGAGGVSASSTSRNGGDGAAGICIVWEFE